ncbi:MAG TPA: LamG-like jellyroll fold domain-containing protein, partial [Sedimentisphaerales bacterium]|nr:LamG-like jellyroll fold domain-containing protein [Sedimentisphaerales bacterium]
MCTDNLKKLSIPALAVLLLMAAASQAMLIHYWPFNLPNPLRNEGRGGAGFPPHDARLVDFHPLYVPPTLVAGRLGRAYDLGTGQNSNILVGGNNISGYTTAHMDGTLPGTPITVSLWFRPHALPDQAVRQFLFSNMQSGGNQDRFFITLFTPNIEGAPSGVTFSVGNTHDFEWHLTPPASHTVVPGTWNHVMMSVRHLGWGQGSQVVYTLNGGPARTVTANTLFNPPVFDRSNKRIGTNGNTLETGKTARAIFDDMAIWSEILPQGATGFNAAQFIWNGGAGRPANVACGRVGYDPIPADKSVGNAGLTQLQWSNSLRLAHRVDVYFSTSLDDLIQLQDAGNPAVNRNIPLTPAGRRIATNLAVTPGSLSTLPITLPAGEDFYWRVDTRSSNPADPNTYHGPVWKFSAGNAPPQV